MPATLAYNTKHNPSTQHHLESSNSTKPHEGTEIGIFTRCVSNCHENRALSSL